MQAKVAGGRQSRIKEIVVACAIEGILLRPLKIRAEPAGLQRYDREGGTVWTEAKGLAVDVAIQPGVEVFPSQLQLVNERNSFRV